MDKIRKIGVTEGVWWVEAPEADFYLLCGTPPDVVKHLMRRGLILPTEKDGVACETGPNVILLSDVEIQGGIFSNMAEFPVAQMLYRQGMLLPGHPNNTGFRPILAGSRDQVRSQMLYIYRGNYGLISEEEIIEAGESPETAREMMNMKLAFAFGEIQKSGEFLDSRIIGNDRVELLNGVFVKRTALNVFELEYEGSRVSVDLNLAKDKQYVSPYKLDFSPVKREYFAVIHSGEGDGWDENRPSMSSVLMFQGKVYLIDAGPNITHILSALGVGINEIEGIFHTHSHDDHFAGLTMLFRADHRIKYYATPLVRASVKKKLSALLAIEEETFNNYFEVEDLEMGKWNDIEGLEVKPIFSPHPVETTPFVFRSLSEDGFRSYAHFADIVSMKVLGDMVRDDPEAPGVSKEFYEKVREEYLVPAGIKKLDIGGGLIHGDTEDFREDVSSRIILAHTANQLTDSQKEVGASVAFGTIDCLTSVSKDYAWQSAYRHLRRHFGDIPEHQIQMLLNNEVSTFRPDAIIVREGNAADAVYLVLSGSVEGISSKRNLKNMFYAGTFIGETSCLQDIPSAKTFRSASFIQALKMPSALYRNFVEHNNLSEEIGFLRGNREVLVGTMLFGEGLSYTVQNEVARSMRHVSYPAGTELSGMSTDMLKLVGGGALELYLGDEIYETLGRGDFFGEESAAFDTPPLFGIRALDNVDIYEIDSKRIRDIPIVLWKLFETFERRKKRLFCMESGEHVFHWRDEFNTDVPVMDEQHKLLFKMCSSLSETVGKEEKKKEIKKAVDFLIAYAEFHFSTEEVLYKKCRYPDIEPHKKKHREMMEQIFEQKHLLEESDYGSESGFIDFLSGWLTDHVISEDRKFSAFYK